MLDQKEAVTSSDSPHTNIEMEDEATSSTTSPNQIDLKNPGCVKALYPYRPMDRGSPLNCVPGQHEPTPANRPPLSPCCDVFPTVAPTPGAASSQSRKDDASPPLTLHQRTSPCDSDNMAGLPSPSLTSTTRPSNKLRINACRPVENFSTTATDTFLPQPCFQSQYNFPYSFAIFCPKLAALSLKMEILIMVSVVSCAVCC